MIDKNKGLPPQFFTVEEENLICSYQKKDRMELLDELYYQLSYQLAVKGGDMILLISKTISKLEVISDAQFASYSFTKIEE